MACVGRHPNILELLGVSIESCGDTCLKYPVWDMTLAVFIEKRVSDPLPRGALHENTHIFKSVLCGLERIHACGLLHTHVRPATIYMVTGCGLSSLICFSETS